MSCAECERWSMVRPLVVVDTPGGYGDARTVPDAPGGYPHHRGRVTSWPLRAPGRDIRVCRAATAETLIRVTVSTPPGRLASVEDSRPNITGGQRDVEMLRRYARTRDPLLREQLVHRYLPLARYAASQYRRGSEPFDDLLQVASVGLLKAIDRYDPVRGAAFSSYALPTMSGE